MKIAIVGGGASGLIAASRVKQHLPDADVVLLERLSRTGKKLLATGNGRCNLTNIHASCRNYHGDTALIGHAMSIYSPENVLAYFRSIGVYAATEDDGRVYPMSGQASSVLDALRMTNFERGVREITDFEIIDVRKVNGAFLLRSKTGLTEQADRVIFSTGGLSTPALGGGRSGHSVLKALGHRITPCLPALVQLKTEIEPIRPLKGMRFDGNAAILSCGRALRTEVGEILFTEYGLSGIAIMQLSRIAAAELHQGNPVEIRLGLVPWSVSETREILTSRKADMPNRAVQDFLTGMINKRIGQTLMKQAGILPLDRRVDTLSDAEIGRLAALFTSWTLKCTGTQSFDQAQVTAGGVSAEDIHPETMESRIVPGLYIAGETVNVDGDCGGFNLQWAWASGLLAADAAAGHFNSERT